LGIFFSNLIYYNNLIRLYVKGYCVDASKTEPKEEIDLDSSTGHLIHMKKEIAANESLTVI